MSKSSKEMKAQAQAMEPKVIDIRRFRGNNSDTYTGRPEGELARRALNLDEVDRTAMPVTVVIPRGTTSINPSFFLGLFYDSIKYLGGVRPFTERYTFDYEDKDPEIQGILNGNIDEAYRYANNILNKRTGLFSFTK